QRLWDESNFLQIDFNRKITAFYKLAFKAKYTADYNRYLDPEYITTEGFLDNTYKQKEAYVSLANELQVLPFWKSIYLLIIYTVRWMQIYIDSRIQLGIP